MQPSVLLSLLSGFVAVTAVPSAQRPSPHHLENRELVSGLVGGVVDGLDDVVSGLLGELKQAVRQRDRDQVLDILGKIKPARNITDIDEAIKAVTEVSKSEPPNTIEYQARLVANGIITGTVSDLLDYAEGFVTGESGSNNR
jgi:hypothetical protein